MTDSESTTDSVFGDSVYEAGDDDAEYFDPAETLTGDTLDGEDLDEPLDTGYSPPDHGLGAIRYGTTELEQSLGESLDQRIAQEEPDIDPDAPADYVASDDDTPAPRSGRIVQFDEGAHPDLESEAIAYDAGRAGNAASAEEAAVHIIDDSDADADSDSDSDGLGDRVLEETLTEDTASH